MKGRFGSKVTVKTNRIVAVSVAVVVVGFLTLSSKASLLSSLNGVAPDTSGSSNVVLHVASNGRYAQWRARRAAGEALDELPPDCMDGKRLAEAYRRYEVRNQVSGKSIRLLASSSLPASYDLRTSGLYSWVTPVRNQLPYNTCWAFSVLGSFESRILAKENAALDLSENNVVTMSGGTRQFGAFGWPQVTLAYLARWDGPGLESEDPYPNASARKNLRPVRRLTDYITLPYRGGALDNDRIKAAIMNYGAVQTAYYDSDDYYNESKAAYYCPDTENDCNHAICIIGWDDGYSANNFRSGCQPPGPGAFIIKNSWGVDRGLNGFDYVSYYDCRLGRQDGTGGVNVIVDYKAAGDEEFLFQYDKFGNCTPVGIGKSSFDMANIFEAEEDCEVTAVSFYMLAPGLTYKAAVLTGFSGLDLDNGSYYGTVSGTKEFSGYHTVSLSEPVRLTAGQRFAVEVALVDPSGSMVNVSAEGPFDESIPATASSGESLYYANSRWNDLTSESGFGQYNFCIKAVARRQSLDAPANVTASRTDEFVLGVTWDPVNGAEGYNIYRSESASRPMTPYRIGETSPFSDYDALPGREYWYWVEATNSTKRGISEGVKGWRPPYLEVSLSQSFPGEGGTTNISVSSTAVWSAVPDRNWIRITRAGVNELIYSVDPNPTSECRSGHITVTSPDDAGATHTSVSTITVYQYGYVPPAAPNDDIEDAQSLGCAKTGDITGSNYGATMQTGSPVYERTVMYSELGTNSVWWTWTAPEDGVATFSLEGSSLSSEIVVVTYSPSAGGLFGPFAKIAQSSGASPCVFDAVSGTTYHLRIAGMWGGFGTVRLSWTFQAASELMGTWYVDAKRGSDSNDGLSWGSSLKTISAAVAKVERGGSIFVNDGVYAESVNAMFKNNLTIRSVNGAEKTMIDGKGQTMLSCVQLSDSGTLVGFTVRNGDGYRGGGANGGFLHQCVLSNNVARIQGGGAYGSVLSNCLIVNNNAPEGGGTFQCELTNCTVVCNSASSTCGGTYSGRAYNSIVWGNTLTGSGTAVNYLSTTFRYSCTSPTVNGTGNIDEDPCLVSSDGTYVLGETSPCINAGANEYATAIGDVFGNARIYGSAVDMGAAESPYLQRVIRKPECDVGFYTFSNYDWSYPLCLSSTNLAGMAFAPEYAFFAGAGPVLNCCAVNYSSKPATVEGLGMSIWDMDGNLTGETVEAISDTINAGGGFNFTNRNLNDWQGGLVPGNYRLMVVLDPDDKLGDPNRSNNATSIWFAVKAKNISLNEALGCTVLDFVSSGIYAPFVQTSESVSGGSCVQFGPQPGASYYNTRLETYVPGAGRLSFKWKSSAYSSQYLVLINGGNGSVVRYIDQTATEWQSSYVDFSEAGTVYWQLWTYPGRQDDLSAAWLDDVHWTPLGCERDISFYAPDAYGWSRPLFLSPTSSEWLSYAPSSTLLEDAPVFLNFCAWNKTIGDEAFLSTVKASVVDEAGAVVTNETLDMNGTIGVGQFYEFNNIPLRCAANLPPGTYDLVLELDPSDLLKDPDRSNNVTGVLFTVMADKVTLTSDVTGGKALDVPHAWFKQFPGFQEQFGGDFASAVRMNTGKRTSSGEMMYVWQDYVAGTDPTDAKDVFKAFISFTNGMPCINWTPDLNANGATVRTYTIEGRESLSHGAWEHPTNSTHRFFRVKVDIP